MSCVGGIKEEFLTEAFRQLEELDREGYTVITKDHYEELVDGPRATAVAEPQTVVLAGPNTPQAWTGTDVDANAVLSVTDEDRKQVAIPTEEFLRLMLMQNPGSEDLVAMARGQAEKKVEFPKFNWDYTPNRYVGQGRTAAHVFWFVVHTTEGWYRDAYNIFKNPGGAQAGPHVNTMRDLPMPNGVDRMCPDSEGSFTEGHRTYNLYSDSLEQSDYFADGRNPFTEETYELNGHLFAYYAQKSVHDLPLQIGFRQSSDYMRGEKGTGTRAGIIGHHHVPYPSTHWDPGPTYDFEKTIFYAKQVLEGKEPDKPLPPKPKPETKYKKYTLIRPDTKWAEERAEFFMEKFPDLVGEVIDNGPQGREISAKALSNPKVGEVVAICLGAKAVPLLDGEARRAMEAYSRDVCDVWEARNKQETFECFEEIVEREGSPALEEYRRRFGGRSKPEAAGIIDRYFADKPHYPHNGQEIVEEAKRAGLELIVGCGLIEHEGAGAQNIFGCDFGAGYRGRPPYCNDLVTKDRLQALLRNVEADGGSNGVGQTQLTYPPFIYEAERLGGAHLTRWQLRVGFTLVASYIRKYGLREGLGAYNAGESNRRSVLNTYVPKVEAAIAGWRERL